MRSLSRVRLRRPGLTGSASVPTVPVLSSRAAANTRYNTSQQRWQSGLPQEVDAVVLGGGSIGASTLYHLQKRGLNAILLDKHQLTSGTTWHSAGMLWRLRPADADIALHAYTRELAKQLEAETEIASFTENGGLFIACNEQRLNEYKRLKELGQYFGIESQICSPSDALQIHPCLRVDDITGGLYSPTDGTMDPTSWVMALAAAAKKLGAKIYENTGVTAVETEASGLTGSKVTAVVTSTGERIRTPVVVNACGGWSREVSLMVGKDIPLRAMKHAFVITEKIEGMHPGLPNVRDHDLSIYLKCQGDALGLGGYEQNPEFWHDIDKDFNFGLFDLDWDTFAQNLAGHIQRCPAVETVGIKSTVCGPESFTPDHKPLVGPQPGVHGFFQANGFNSMGLMLAGGMGRELARWITEGSPEVDLFSFDCARFHGGLISDSVWVLNRTHESYAKTYATVFPHDEALAGRHARVSGVYDDLLNNGCVFQARQGFERPGWFLGAGKDTKVKPYDFYAAYGEEGLWRIYSGDENPVFQPPHEDHLYHRLIDGELTFDTWGDSFDVVKEECRAAREGVAIFDQSYFGNFHIKGADAEALVEWMSGIDIKKKAVNSVTYTSLCNDRGGCEADLTIAKLAPDHYYMSTGGATSTKDKWWVQRVIGEKGFQNVDLIDTEDTVTILSIQGPHSRKLLQQVFGEQEGAKLSDENLAFSCITTLHSPVDNTTPVHALRITFVGELGFELHVPADQASELYQQIKTVGAAYEAEHGVPIRDAGYRAIDTLSAEKNFRHWHADLSNADTPLEAGIGFTVLPKLKNSSIDFKGREALEKQRADGLRRKLVCLVMEGEQSPLHGHETFWRDGECVGFVKSTAFGHTIGKQIAYGYVDRDKKITNKWLEAGKWEIGIMGQKKPATLHLKAPFDPKNERVKG